MKNGMFFGGTTFVFGEFGQALRYAVKTRDLVDKINAANCNGVFGVVVNEWKEWLQPS